MGSEDTAITIRKLELECEALKDHKRYITFDMVEALTPLKLPS